MRSHLHCNTYVLVCTYSVSQLAISLPSDQRSDATAYLLNTHDVYSTWPAVQHSKIKTPSIIGPFCPKIHFVLNLIKFQSSHLQIIIIIIITQLYQDNNFFINVIKFQSSHTNNNYQCNYYNQHLHKSIYIYYYLKIFKVFINELDVFLIINHRVERSI